MQTAGPLYEVTATGSRRHKRKRAEYRTGIRSCTGQIEDGLERIERTRADVAEHNAQCRQSRKLGWRSHIDCFVSQCHEEPYLSCRTGFGLWRAMVESGVRVM